MKRTFIMQQRMSPLKKGLLDAVLVSTCVVGVIFFLVVMTKAPGAGPFLIAGGLLAFFRKLWLGLMALLAAATLYNRLRKP